MSDSVRPHRQQPTRLPRPWDSPGKNTGVGCHFLLQCMKWKVKVKSLSKCPTLRNPKDCSLSGSSIHGIFQARVLQRVAIAFSIQMPGKCKNKFLYTVQFSLWVVSDSLWPHGLQHSRLPCPSFLQEFAQIHVYWVGDAIQPSHHLLPLLTSCPQSFPASGSFSMSSLFTSSGQSIGASASVVPINIQGWFPLGLTDDWFDLLAVRGTLKSLFQSHNLKASVFQHSAFFVVQLSHPCMTTGKTIALTVTGLLHLYPFTFCQSDAHHGRVKSCIAPVALQRG